MKLLSAFFTPFIDYVFRVENQFRVAERVTFQDSMASSTMSGALQSLCSSSANFVSTHKKSKHEFVDTAGIGRPTDHQPQKRRRQPPHYDRDYHHHNHSNSLHHSTIGLQQLHVVATFPAFLEIFGSVHMRVSTYEISRRFHSFL